MAEFLLRDAFTKATIEQIAAGIEAVHPGFDGAGFRKQVWRGFSALSFGDRSKKIRDGLRHFLPKDFPTAASILVRSLGPEPETEELSGFDGFYVFPLCSYVGTYGLDHPDVALPALYEMTKRFTAEGDIRPFIQKYPKQTLAFLKKLTRDPSPFARRLASEGTRPRLPLAGRLPDFQKDPTPVIALLDLLYRDPTLVVRRSVANNLNDIAKDNPEVVVSTLARWQKANPSPELDWMIRHALRTLIKQNHPGALQLLGFGSGAKELTIKVEQVTPRKLKLGESLHLSWSIRSSASRSQRLALNYVLYFKKANGQNKPKVFRLPTKTIAPKEKLLIEKTHKLRDFRNQTFYSGTQYVELVVNGKASARTAFELKV